MAPARREFALLRLNVAVRHGKLLVPLAVCKFQTVGQQEPDECALNPTIHSAAFERHMTLHRLKK